MPFDWPLAIIVLTLVVFGLVMVFSSSYATGIYRKDDAFVFIRKQIVFAFIGLAAMIAASVVDYHIFHRFAWPIMGVTLILLVIVLFMPAINNAKRWITIPGIGTLQPSDVAKFAVIVLFAHIISVNHDKMKRFSYGVLPFITIMGVIAGLMLLEPHLSGTVLIFGIGAIMMFVGGTGLLWFGIAIGGASAAVVGALVLMPDLVPYVESRLNYWIDPFSDALGKGHQTIQSMYAIASGKLFGKGIGNSVQKHLYVPEPQNDFIFAITCEELGFVGAMLVIGLFVALLLRGLYIAVKAKDKFGSLLVVGVIMQITLQAALNIAVVTNLIPNTGISLPFFSAGGTSLTMLMGEIGVVLSVSRQSGVYKT
ncbi:MAG: cell division protein FtsW [Oscillospiraceae bacterium]|nr:cell division protein FtsW [Oscillospiraceae bacterium]